MNSVLYSALQSRGIPSPKEEVTSDKFTRWGKKFRYWAIQFVGGYSFGDFSSGEHWEAFEENYDREKCKNEIRTIQKKMSEEKKFEQAKAAVAVQQIWNEAAECFDHPYLQTKKVKAYGLKTQNEKLLIPIFDENDNLVSMQSIWQVDSQKFFKKFFAGARKKGCYFVIGNISSEVIICEGYATGASIHECIEKPIVIAFDSNNLLEVAKTIRKKYPDAKITIAADNDKYNLESGNVGVTKAKEAAININANVAIPEFENGSEKPTDFNDLFILEGVEKVREIFEKSQQENAACDCELDGFRLTEDKLFYYDERSEKYVFVSGYVKVIAQTEDSDGENTGKLLEFKTRRGQLRRLRVLNCWLSKDGDKMREFLLKNGLKISTNGRAKLMLNEYINNCDPAVFAKFIKISGWYENGFITENGFIGKPPKELVIHQSDADPSFVETSGTVEEWKQHIAKPCEGNSRLVLAISSAFASILLKSCDRENFGLNFVGKSSEGKTTTLYVAASVFGSHKYIKPWKATDNGLEGVAVTHNDMLLILDEIALMDSKKIGEAIYMLANGMGKTRANIHGAARKTQIWRLGLLSSGEKDLAAHMAESNKKMHAGQSIRLLTIPARPTPDSKGLLERLNGFPSYNALTNHLKTATGRYYGSPMLTFIESLMEEDAIKRRFDIELEKAKESHLPISAEGQDHRVFDIFFTFGFAGELATRYGITGWPIGEAMSAALRCFNDWIEDKGGYGNQEEKQWLAQIKSYLETFAQIRFQRIVNHKTFDNTFFGERAGYVEEQINACGDLEDVYYVFPEYFKNTIAKGIPWKAVTRLLVALGIMEPGSDKDRVTAYPYINGKRQRMYVINSKIFEA
ncbi:alkaline-shock protein [Alphaproteobacteria bacterium]|nr:alkaline-shock protein [Alphaproteobacteria bacterium]